MRIQPPKSQAQLSAFQSSILWFCLSTLVGLAYAWGYSKGYQDHLADVPHDSPLFVTAELAARKAVNTYDAEITDSYYLGWDSCNQAWLTGKITTKTARTFEPLPPEDYFPDERHQ